MKLLLPLLLFCLPFNGSNGGKELLDKALDRCERLETLENYRDILSRYGVSDKIPLACPLKDRFRKSSGFGIRIHPITGKRSFHSGIDMAVGLAAPVYATASGTVSFAGRKGGYGRCVIIRHSYGFETLYAHLAAYYIANNNGCTPAKAELVWQDVMDLVTDIKYNAGSNGGNISFKVDRFSIQQGNAVIAIKDASNNVLWSWHIWVTDENIDNVIEVTNYQNVKYNIMPVNLGWCDDDVTTYAERSCKVRFTAGDASKEVTIRQVSASITIRGNHPYYQWGRKDPLRPSNGLANTNKTWYDKNGTSSQSNPATENFSAGVTCIMNYILKPDVMQNQVSGDNAYANLWSVDNTVYTANDNPVVKTVYDPSPVGFKLPPGNVFTGFTTTGGSTSTSSEINGTWSSSSLKGWNFYTDSSKSKTIFFPASGYRYRSNGMVSNVSSDGFYWSAVPSSPTKGHYLYFSSLQVIPLSTSNYRAVGFGVRSCQE